MLAVSAREVMLAVSAREAIFDVSADMDCVYPRVIKTKINNIRKNDLRFPFKNIRKFILN
jgi:hypothetical protein